jgi:hypothetical protein
VPDWISCQSWMGQQQYTYEFELVDGITGLSKGLVRPDRGSTVTLSHDTTRLVKRTVSGLTLMPSDAVRVNTVRDQIYIRMVTPDGEEYPLGMYRFVDNSRIDASYGQISSTSLADEMWIIDQPLSKSFSAAAIPPDKYGEPVDNAAQRLLAGFKLKIKFESTSYKSLGSWQAGTSRAQALGELARDGAYWPPWFDNDGVLRLVQSFDPALRLATFDWDDVHCVVRDTVVYTDNLIDAPNRFIVISNADTQSDVGSRPIWGTYDVPASAPHSFANRGFLIVDRRDEQVTSSAQAKKLARSTALLEAPFELLEVSTLPNPLHDSYDIIRWDGFNWLETSWSLPLVTGGLMRHTLQKVYT